MKILYAVSEAAPYIKSGGLGDVAEALPAALAKEKDVEVNVIIPYYELHKDTNETPVYLPQKNGRITNSDFFGGNLKGITEKLQYIKDMGVGIIYLNPVFMAYSNHRYDTAELLQLFHKKMRG